MHIIILGGGITGFSTYLALRKNLPPSTSIRLYESHSASSSPDSAAIGGGVGLAPNALRALSSISRDIRTKLQSSGFSKAGILFRNSKGTDLGVFLNGSKERYGYSQLFLRRSTVHEALIAELNDATGADIEYGKKAVLVTEIGPRSKVRVKFHDGSMEEADLVLGADGVRSCVRHSLLGDEFDAEYQGLTGIGGFLSLDSLPEEFHCSFLQDGVTMTFGSDGFFGYSLSTPIDSTNRSIMWWSTYASSEPPSRELSVRDIEQQLIQRHGDWRSPHDTESTAIFRQIIELACDSKNNSHRRAVDSGVLILPVYTTPLLPRWSSNSGRILLLGDAAHAMPPDAGQGVAAGVEDAVTVSLLLKEFGSGDKGLVAVKEAYEELRMSRMTKLLRLAKMSGDQKRKLGWWGEFIRDWFMWALCKVPEGWRGDEWFGYDAEAAVKKFLMDMKATDGAQETELG